MIRSLPATAAPGEEEANTAAERRRAERGGKAKEGTRGREDERTRIGREWSKPGGREARESGGDEDMK
jgi:hypothetical protein